jgi:hypothetical protein
MRVQLLEKCGFTPDSSRIVAVILWTVIHEQKMLSHIMTLDEKQVVDTLEQTLREFARRHRNFKYIL